MNNPCENHRLQLSRRDFLVRLTMAAGFPFLTSCGFGVGDKQEFLISAQGKQKKSYGLSWLDTHNKQFATALSGFRGHGAGQHPLRKTSIVMVARRPGTSAVEVDLKTGDIEKTFHCRKNRHFLGHGCFSRDGNVLFTTEADYQNGNGKIGIRDALTYQQIDEYDSHGIGPHEIKLMPDGKTLVIANGGILTHPDSGRKKLNLDSMESSLIYLDLASGKELGAFKVPEKKASIRHLDVASDGTVALSMQMQREAAGHNHTVPLGALHKSGEPIQLLKSPRTLIDQMNDYVGSVVINEFMRTAGFTSPRGNIAAFWHIDSGELQGYHSLQDVCGLAVTTDQKSFMLSNSFGQIRQLDAITLKENLTNRTQRKNTHWDNHLLVAAL